MTVVSKYFWTVMVLSCAAAQTRAEKATVLSVTAEPDRHDLRLEVTLSSPVEPTVELAAHPDRILLDFPETITDYRNFAVHEKGVRRIQIVQHSTNPLIARVILDLDQGSAYTLQTGQQARIDGKTFACEHRDNLA
jgi:hypothetical protein